MVRFSRVAAVPLTAIGVAPQRAKSVERKRMASEAIMMREERDRNVAKEERGVRGLERRGRPVWGFLTNNDRFLYRRCAKSDDSGVQGKMTTLRES